MSQFRCLISYSITNRYSHEQILTEGAVGAFVRDPIKNVYKSNRGSILVFQFGKISNSPGLRVSSVRRCLWAQL